MTNSPSEKQVRTWAREEWDELERQKQARCRHARSATLHPSGELRCDQCDKLITAEDVHFSDTLAPIEQRSVDLARGVR